MKFTAECVVLLLAGLAAANHDGIKQKKHGRSEQSALQLTSLANNKFSLSLYKGLNYNNTEDSMVMSPISLQFALGMTYLGARGNTATQMAAALHFPADQSTVKAGFRQMLSTLRSSDLMTLEVANRIYLQSNYNVLKEFKRSSRKFFGSDIKEVNFEKSSEKARKIINNWVEKRTRQKIKQIIGPGVLTAMTRLVLVNAVYFKANWQQAFNSDDTKLDKFHINSNNVVEMPMMHMKTYFHYKQSQSLGARILELPYESDTVSMYIILPDEMDGLADVESRLSTIDLAATFNEMESEELKIAVPRFKQETSYDLKSLLMDLGFKDMFKKEDADFSGISGNKGLYISHVLQKAFVEVTELGTEAGASSAVVAEARSWRPPPPEFIADHPFLFVIWEKTLNIALLMGRFAGPQ